VVHVTCEGVARLPEGAKVTLPSLIDPVYDAEHAEVRGRFVPPADQRSISVTVTAPGYASAELIAKLPRPGTEVRVTANLKPVRRVRATVVGPTWAATALALEEQHAIARQKIGNTWVEADGKLWLPAKVGRRVNLNKAESLWKVREGRYRLVLQDTPFVLREFEVARDDVDLRIDLTRAGRQEIVLGAPSEVPMADARLVADGHSFLPRSHEAGEARFSLPLPGDREVVLEPSHPFAETPEPLRLLAPGAEIAVDLRLRRLVRFELPADVKGDVSFVLSRGGVPVRGGDAREFAKGYALVADPGSYRLQVFVSNQPRFDREIVVPAVGLDLGIIPLR